MDCLSDIFYFVISQINNLKELVSPFRKIYYLFMIVILNLLHIILQLSGLSINGLGLSSYIPLIFF